mgnify:CR=1 FL=1
MMRWLLLILAGLALQANAQGGFYKWVDEKGVVHYSDKAPPGKAGGKMQVKRPASPDANERRFQEEKKQKETQQKAQEAEQKCLRARSALDSLKQERPLYRVDQQGERVFMEDEERRRLTDSWQQQADSNCR